MTTKEKIDAIIKERYSNYQPEMYRNIGVLHGMIRNITVPYTKWQLIKCFLGFGLPERRVINNDEAFLSFLLKLEIDLPKPVYNKTKVNEAKTIRPLIVGDEILHIGTWDWPRKTNKN